MTVNRLRLVRFIILFAIALTRIVSSQPALAHATSIRTEPADGAVLPTPPAEVQFWFNEPFVFRFTSVHLINEQNQTIQGPAAGVHPDGPDALTVTLPALGPGTYTLFWKVLSDVDGHFSQGFTVFHIGQAAVTSTATVTSSTNLPLTEGALRWLHFVLLSSVVGALVVAHLVLLPGATQTPPAFATAADALYRRVLRWSALCAGVAFLVSLGLLAWQVVLAQEGVPAKATWLRHSTEILTQSHWGTLWLVRQGILFILCTGLWLLASRVKKSSSWLQLAIMGRAFDLLIVQALIGHALGAGGNWLLALTSTTIHLLAASVWMGGLLTMAVIVLPTVRWMAEANAGWQPIRWRTFSLLAVVSVGLLLATGLYNSGRQVASLDALVTTSYGQLLMGKIGMVFFMGSCGLLNALLVHPQVTARLGQLLRRTEEWQPLAIRHLPRLIGLEVILGILIFGVTGLLTTTAPPRGVEYTIAPEEVHQELGQRVDDLFVSLAVKPNKPGQNLFNIRSVNTKQPSVHDIVRVSLNLTYMGEDARVERVNAVIAEEVEPGLFQLAGKYLTRPGPWQIEVVALRSGAPDRVVSFPWVVPPSGALHPVVLSKYRLAKVTTPAAVMLIILLAVVILGLRLGFLPSSIANTRHPLSQSDPHEQSMSVS